MDEFAVTLSRSFAAEDLQQEAVAAGEPAQNTIFVSRGG